MAQDTVPDEVVIVHRPLWQRVLKWIGIAIAALAFLLLVVVFGINTDPGRRFVADQLGNYRTAGGLNIKVGRIDGSLYGKMVLSDVRVSDPKGVFLTSPRLDVDWRPFAFINNHVDVRSLESGLVTLARNPEFIPQPTDPNAPFLPDLDIDIDRLRIARFVMEPAVAGKRHIGRIEGSAHIADRRAQLLVDAAALRGPGVAGGDTLTLKLDAVPDDDKLDVDARLFAPAGGLLSSIAGTKAPLTATVGGQGSWKGWSGKAVATLGAGRLADLNLSARDGRIAIRGVTRPGLYLEEPVERLTAPQLDVAIDATLAERRADTRIKLRSAALTVDAGGIIDLANSRFGNFAADATLLTPGAIAPNLRGRDVLARVVLNGAFATPTVDYKVRATALGFAETTVENLYAEGQARVDADRILVPVHARARRITGLNPALGGLTTNVRLDGDLAIDMPTILSDNLRIRSDTIDATAIVAANMETGRYTGALKGRVNNFRVESVGILNLNTDAELVARPGGGFGIVGRIGVQTRQIFNDGARSFLGGNAVAFTNFGYDTDGIVTFRNLKLTAPKFRVTRGQGRYNLNTGAVLVEADAYSAQYGPLFARVSGSAAAPVVNLRAPRPGLGVGLADLDARIVGRNGAYAVTARGGTTYGPFTADVLVRPGQQIAIDVNRVVFAGVNFTGRVVQTAAGPFAGRVNFSGSGLNGAVALAPQGAYQRADVNARAYNAKIPGSIDFVIGRAIVNASIVLFDTPQVIADAQVADLRYGPTVIQAGRVKVNYAGGRGTAQALFEGSNGVPFRLAANARLSPNNYLVALQGRANGINFRTGNPARITAENGVYALAPTQLLFDQGRLRVAGRYGNGVAAQLRLDTLDLAVANALIPNLGVAGKVTGSLDFAQVGADAFPQADARLTITGFTRSGLAAVSQPVDVQFAGRLVPSGAEALALIKRGSTTVGRMQAFLRPVSGGGSWVSQLLAAPLSGGIRYNGPAGVLFSFLALPNQQLNGPIVVAADFSGRVTAPQINGVVRADTLTYDNETYGTRLSQMRVRARFTADRLQIDELRARAGDGSVQAQGFVSLAAADGFPLRIDARLDNAQLARSDAIGASASGTMTVTNDRNGGLIKADLTIPEARYQIIRQGSAEVPELTGVRRKSDIREPRITDRPAAAAPPSLFKLDIRLRANNRLFVSGMGLESEWEMDMRIGGTTNAPDIRGGLDVVRGTYSFAGKEFEIERGRIRFRGGALTDPDLDIRATTESDGITFVINITGTGERPQIEFTSTPSLPQDEVLSRLLFGTNPENLSAIEAIQLASALNSLRGSDGGLNPLGKLRSATGFDRLRVIGADSATGRGTSLAAGKYLTDDIYIEIVTDARGFTATQLTIALTKSLSLLT